MLPALRQLSARWRRGSPACRRDRRQPLSARQPEPAWLRRSTSCSARPACSSRRGQLAGGRARNIDSLSARYRVAPGAHRSRVRTQDVRTLRPRRARAFESGRTSSAHRSVARLHPVKNLGRRDPAPDVASRLASGAGRTGTGEAARSAGALARRCPPRSFRRRAAARSGLRSSSGASTCSYSRRSPRPSALRRSKPRRRACRSSPTTSRSCARCAYREGPCALFVDAERRGAFAGAVDRLWMMVHCGRVDLARARPGRALLGRHHAGATRS